MKDSNAQAPGALLLHFQALLCALQFMTLLPVGRWLRIQDNKAMRTLSAAYYPFAGLAIAAILWLVLSVTNNLPASITAALLLIVWVAITGALHLDGLADSGDALLGGLGNKERSLDIMKDPSAGTIAVVALSLLLLLKLVALLHLVNFPQAIVASCIIGRASAMFLFVSTDYVRHAGIGSAAADNPARQAIFISLAISLLVVVALLGLSLAAVALTVTMIVAFYWRQLWINRIDGFTGDTAGASIELCEAALLFSCAIYFNLP
ncbi:MAG: adenosylcobinamide-GDP ribazoletransferase [Pseudomonadales bacterium]